MILFGYNICPPRVNIRGSDLNVYCFECSSRTTSMSGTTINLYFLIQNTSLMKKLKLNTGLTINFKHCRHVFYRLYISRLAKKKKKKKLFFINSYFSRIILKLFCKNYFYKYYLASPYSYLFWCYLRQLIVQTR